MMREVLKEVSPELRRELKAWQSVGGKSWEQFDYDEDEAQSMTELHAGYTNDEICDKGRRIYEEQIRELVEPDRVGHYVVIDVDTGEYEVDEDHLTAGLRLMEKRPNGARYGMRIGFRTAGRIGFGPFSLKSNAR
jgi:hypothetical protein